MTGEESRRQCQLIAALESLGFNLSESIHLRRISMTLRRWFELECGNDRGAIERDETTGKPYFLSARSGLRSPVADREAGAMRRLARIMKDVNARRAANASPHAPPLATYIQTDPRGAALYIIRPGDIPAGSSVESCYSRGICVY